MKNRIGICQTKFRYMDSFKLFDPQAAISLIPSLKLVSSHLTSWLSQAGIESFCISLSSLQYILSLYINPACMMAAFSCCSSFNNGIAMILLMMIISSCTYKKALAAAGKVDDDLGGQLGASFIFGDSLVDAGNNNYLPTLSKADSRPNGIDFEPSGGNPTGRFTNGKTIGDIVGEELGTSTYAVPFLAPNATGKNLLYGVNYASGGGGILNATGKIFVNRLGMDIQLDYFTITRKQIDKLLGPSKARDYIQKRSIFSVTVGSNDFLNNYLLPVVSVGARVTQTPDAFIGEMISHLRNQLTRMYKLDARKFVVGNVGPLGCIPYQMTIYQLKEGECEELPNKLARNYNARLKDLLTELNENLPGSTFIYANVYDLVMELITNYKHYGFKTASTACCGNGGQYAGIIPCGPQSSMCSDRDKHVFWDPYHPSQAANILLAKQLMDGDTRYVSPMNLRQLRTHIGH